VPGWPGGVRADKKKKKRGKGGGSDSVRDFPRIRHVPTTSQGRGEGKRGGKSALPVTAQGLGLTGGEEGGEKKKGAPDPRPVESH